MKVFHIEEVWIREVWFVYSRSHVDGCPGKMDDISVVVASCQRREAKRRPG